MPTKNKIRRKAHATAKKQKDATKTAATNAPIPKSEIKAIHVDFERLFDTLFMNIRTNLERRRILSHRAHGLHRAFGRGIFIVRATDDNGRIRTDIDTLYHALEWWTHERCATEPLPDYYPETYRYLHQHDVNSDFIIGMYWHDARGKGLSTLNTLGHYNPGTEYLLPARVQPGDLNPYKESNIGEVQTFWGKQCGAEGCDVMKAKRTVYTDCEDCGGNCASEEKYRIDNRGDKRLQLCSQCQQIAYCSRECQVKDWPRHRPICKKLRKEMRK